VLFLSKRQIIKVNFLLILVFLVSGCQQTTRETAVPDLEGNRTSTTAHIQKGITQSPIPSQVSTQETSSTTRPEATPTKPTSEQPTPAPTLSDWRNAPISPEAISDRVIQIYQNGQRLGRDPLSFSVIGDCQSIPYVFLGPFSREELAPSSAESHLWKAINAFNPSFKRWAVTARGGFTAASILNPLQADPELCKPGETPLTCEFRLNNPAFVIITLETWLDPESIDRYDTYLRLIVDAVIEQGAVPILLTKADSSELRSSQHIINPVIVNLAYENQLPLVNFWRAAQYLDNYGIDPEREGFHLSQDGYNLKNILALRALYQVWTTVEDISIAETETNPTQTPTLEPTPSDDLNADLPKCENNCIFFGTAQSQDGKIISGGVYAYDSEKKVLQQVLPEGFDLQDVSTDGNDLLVNHQNRLYTLDLTNGSSDLVTETFYHLGKQGAYWDEQDEDIIFLDTSDPIQTDSGFAFNLLPDSGEGIIFFEVGACTSKDFCQSNGIYQQGPDNIPVKVEKFIQAVFSPDGSRVAYLNPNAATNENYNHIWYMVVEETELGAASRQILYFPEESGFMVYPEVKNYAFSPGSNKLLILYNVYSEYYRHSLRLQTYLLDFDSGLMYDYGLIEGLSGSLAPQLVWSPNGNQVFFFLTTTSAEGIYHIHLYKTDLVSGEKLTLSHEDLLRSENYLYLTNVFWR
jgi:hypothetical protein